MAGKPSGHSLPSRPPLTTHQSNSVPSTPHQHARDFNSRSRTPSPHGGLGLGSHSPRSAISEANGPMTKLPYGRPTCKYETSAAFSRRRMQYDIGDAPLERPKEVPKKVLDPEEEKKLSGDMRELYDRLLPSPESDKRRQHFVDKLDRILRKEWPGNEFHVHLFGSSGNMLCTSESDVDICIQTPMKKLESMHGLAEALANNGMERVICVAAAKVPIVKIWDPELKLAADVNVNNLLALENTRMIKTYVQIDDRVRPLAMVIKHWTKQRILNDAGTGGTLSSYAWICMILNFLQTRNPPILPALHQLSHKTYIANDGTESGFSDDVESLRRFGKKNKETIGDLLFHFFRFYAHELEYDGSVISVRHGRVLTRKEKGWDMSSKEGQWRLCVEEPFNTTRNLGNSADATAFRGIHLELRQAFDLLADGGQLEKACEQYQFPPEEKVIFKKPTPAPKPVLSAAILPQPPRNPRNMNNGNLRGRGGPGPRPNPIASSRRASSGAAFGRNMSYMHTAPMSITPTELVSHAIDGPFVRDAYANQLWQTYQLLGQRVDTARAQLAHHQAQQEVLHAQSAAAAHAQAVIQGQGSSRPDFSTTASPQRTPYLGGSPQLQSAAPARPTSYDTSSRTSPSSPLLPTAIPARRGMQRTTSQNGSQSSAVRSQSQPARGINNSTGPYAIYRLGYDPQMNHQYLLDPNTQVNQTPNIVPPAGQENMRPDMRYITGYHIAPITAIDGSPKEYVGYYMNQAVQPQPRFQNQPVAEIPPYGELASRRNRIGDLQPLPLNGTQHTSRSPSPLGHSRTYSTPLRSAPLPVSSDAGFTHMDPGQFTTDFVRPSNGLLIASGASYSSVSPPESDIDFSRDMARSANQEGSDVPSLDPSFEDDLQPRGAITGTIPQFGEASFVRSRTDPHLLYPANGITPESPHRPTVVSTSQRILPSSVGPTIVSSSGSLLSNDPVTPLKPNTKTNAEPKANLPPIDLPSATSDGRKPPGGESKPAPLLSPVLETRTPSPIVSRRPEIRKPINGITSDADAGKTQHIENGELKGPTTKPRSKSPNVKKEVVPPTTTPAAPKASQAQWQTQMSVPPSRTEEMLPIPPTPAPTAGDKGDDTTAVGGGEQGKKASTWQTASGGRHKRQRKRAKSVTGSVSGGGSPSTKVEPKVERIEERKGG